MRVSSHPVRVVGVIKQRPIGLVLTADGGGEWELGHSRAARKLIGQRVEMAGRRTGFGELSCEQVWREGQTPPRKLTLGFENWIVGTFVAYGLISSLIGLLD